MADQNDQPSEVSDDDSAPAHEHVTWETLDRRAVGRVASHVQLRRLRQVTSNSFLHPNFISHPPGPDWAEQVSTGFDSYLLHRADDGLSFAATTFFIAQFGPETDASAEPGEERETDIELSVRFVLEYELDEPLDESDIEHFCFFNATYNAWPYWREFAQRTTNAMGLMPPLLVTVLPVPQID